MTQQSNNVVTQDDEIDLVALMFSLWKRKWTIVWTTIIFAIGSIGYALFAPQVWTSTATITQPQMKNIVNYLGQIQQYTSIGNQYTKMPSYLFDQSWLFDKFKNVLLSREYQAFYLKQTDFYKKALQNGESSHRILNTLFKDIKINKFDAKDAPVAFNGITVSFSGPTPELAQTLLKGLIENADNYAKQNIFENQVARVNDLHAGLELELNRIQENVKATKENKIQVLEQALQIAKKAGIKDYQPIEDANGRSKPSINDNLLFMLGERNLTAQLESLKASPYIYPTRYYQIKAQLDALTELTEHDKPVKFQTYTYQDAPSYPVNRTKPKRAIIVVAGTVAGGVIGVLLALFMNAITTYRRKEDLSK
ncbi:hypothetical protein A6A19_02170 [Actinobacillus delphinicola]|uniref:LPS O-antigen chain length determinant protein WzzB n=1 Tax=Actinobacillus delphinicola TaxID=51161 RepID=UPI00244248FD|nr:Wzz/FepE/Etk N-terminal domain-containing protein [Actinobacillus delphinicola]MDG6896834.1 hypothetical protein [Actinobacillus delphinicola]